ncbi:MAG TPA: helix-turn-helix domain-containing protein [Pyrinomonadaceae bacterium]|nr:helix-turn-helix domain-containing protein [Pyrinomonadaceae bacterium]
MTLAEGRLKELENPALSADERALLRCRLAAEFIYTGQYEDARKVLGGFWRGVGQRPDMEGLEESTAAEVLLQVGALSGWIGASRQVQGAQESAKDLISESAALFEKLGEPGRVAAARSDLAVCYWREGAYDEARVLLTEAATQAGDDAGLRAKIVLRLVVVEACAGRYSEALLLLTDSTLLFERSTDHAVKGRFHNELAIVLQELGAAERRRDYFDRAIIEYTAAIYHYEQAGHERYKATNENNLAFLLTRLGRYRDAHGQLDHAGATLRRLNDAGLLAQVDETRARVFIAEKKYGEADRVVTRAIQALEKGGGSALLADALTTHGVVLARLGDNERSINILRRAADVAEGVGALSNAGLAVVTLIEEHGPRRELSQMELYKLYRRADRLLKDTQDAEHISRLRACARIVLRRLIGGRLRDRGFRLSEAVHEFEARFIEQALEETGGIVTRAAKLLGMRHQSFISMLNARHKQLLGKRTPPEKHPRSIIKEPKE